MRTRISGRSIGCVLLAALLISIGAHAAVTDTKKLLQAQPVSAVADTQAGARRQGAVNIGGINWACSGARCSASTMPSAVASPLALCQGLAREVGAIRSFTLANRPLNGNELQQCNSVVPAVTAALPGMKPPQGAGLPPAAPVPRVALPPVQSTPRLNKAPVAGFAPPSPQMSDLARKPPVTGDAYRVRGGEDNKSNIQFGDGMPGRRLPSGRNDQTAMPSAKRPSATPQAPMKSSGGFVPQVAMMSPMPVPAKKPSGAKGSPPPPQPPPPAAGPRPAAPFSPVAVRTPRLTLTGTGRSE